MSTLQSPVSAGLLSPISYKPRSSYDGPPSPAFWDTASALTTPPSPTLSNHSSMHFQSSLALRDNKPEQESGMSSLGLLNPYDVSTSGLSHHRKPSNATFSSMPETEGDHADAFDLQHMKSNATSFTHVNSHSISQGSHKKTDSQENEYQERKPQSKGEHETDGEHKTAHQRELPQDEAIDCTPFRFKPFRLAHMLDLENLKILARFGSSSGLLHGLGTTADHELASPLGQTKTDDMYQTKKEILEMIDHGPLLSYEDDHPKISYREQSQNVQMFSEASDVSIRNSEITNVGGDLTINNYNVHLQPDSEPVKLSLKDHISHAISGLKSELKSDVFHAIETVKDAIETVKILLPRPFSTTPLEERVAEDVLKYPPILGAKILMSKTSLYIPGLMNRLTTSVRYAFFS